MATNTPVAFEGRRWPAARIPSPFSNRDGRIIFTASGKGQQWSAVRPLAFWRNFSEFDLPEKDQVLRLLTRHGDPIGQLDRTAAAGGRIVSDNSSWGPLIKALKQVAVAWDEPDALGISSWGGDGLRAEAADKALRKLLPADPDGDPQISNEIDVLYTRQGLTLRPQTLRAFMAISAASARERAVDMRRCLFCNDWFELRRRDAVFCSPSCQAADHKRRSSETAPQTKMRR